MTTLSLRFSATLAGAFACTVSTAFAALGGETAPLRNYDAYARDVAAAARGTRANRGPRVSRELTNGRAAQLDPQMNKATFVWAGTNEPVAVVGPLLPEAMIDARARDFLRRQGPAMGLTPALLDQAVLFDAQDLGHGPVIARYEQYLDGVEVFQRYLNVMLTRAGKPVAASGYFATDFDAADVRARGFSRGAASAVRSALADLGGGAGDYELSPGESHGAYQSFTARPLLAGALRLTVMPRAKRVYFPRTGTLEPGWYVELQGVHAADDSRFAHAHVISAVDSSVLFRNDLIAYEAFQYRVWADPVTFQPDDAPLGNGYAPFPAATKQPLPRVGAPQQLVTLDHAGISTGDAWLAAGATETLSNHVDACLDHFDTPVSGVISNPSNTCNPELGDFRGEVSSPGAFDYALEADADPAGPNGPEAGITMLFYMNNWLHDWWYDHGFNEVARNAQTDNFGRGGAGNDPVKAQGQDASGRNNANMATPADGSSPTMQQYLFDGFISGEVRQTLPIDSGPLMFTGAAFGPTVFDITDTVVLANDGFGSPTDGCGQPPPDPTVPTPAAPPQLTLNGNIALIDRGGCNFTAKAQFASSSGAVGMIVVNNTDADPITMGNGDIPVNAGASPSDPAYQIPAVMIRKADGDAIKVQLPTPVTMHMQRNESQDQDGTLDNQIVAHEYFHYVSNRLVGNASGLSNNQGRSMGEGWGDLGAMMLSVRADDTSVVNNDRWQGPYALAWYVAGTPWNGIRRVPYSTDFAVNAFTFTHIQNGTATPDGGAGATNSEVHNAGEVWANMVWSCYAGILNVPGNTFADSQFRMKDYLIAGMKMTPSSPTYTEARDGILAAAIATDYEDFAACARGFARRGNGVYAVSPPRTSTTHVGVTESYIALVTRFAITKVAFVADPDDFCDSDSALDSGESGTLEFTFRNDGTFRPEAPFTATISTTAPGVTLGNGGVVTLPVLQLGESTTVTLPVSAGTLADTPHEVPLQVTYAGVGEGDAEVEPPAPYDTSFFANHDGGLRDSDDMEDTTTSPQDWTRTESGAVTWTQADAANANQGVGKVWRSNDPGTPGDSSLVTPEFQVPAGGSFQLEFKHFFDTEDTYDGGVIEVQVDGGGWTDVIAAGATFTQGNGYNDTVAALNDRNGFTGTNSANEAMTLSFGTTLGGHSARLRFRFASDDVTSGTGWFIDDVKLNGIAEGVFNFFADENGVCIMPITVSAGSDFSAPEHPVASTDFSTVELAGSVTDPNAPPLSVEYQWTQVSGPAVTLADDTTLTPRFTAPSVDASTDLTFELLVTGGDLILGTDQVKVTITDVNLAPVANAGADKVTDERLTVSLSGSGSDPDGGAVTYAWTQVGAPAVTLNNANTANPTFRAPDVELDTVLVFKLTVSDGAGASTDDVMLVTVKDVPQPVRIGNNNAGGLGWLTLAGLGIAGLMRRRKARSS